MIIASQKKKENIAEYLLYMWQIEDIIRAYGLDIDQIQKHIIDSYDLPEEQKKSMRDWYESLIDMMHSEGVEKKGHLQLNKKRTYRLDRFAPAFAEIYPRTVLRSSIFQDSALYSGAESQIGRGKDR